MCFFIGGDEMAKNDYYTVVYYVLSYLYECLKVGQKPKREILDLSTYPERISDAYLIYIYKNLINDKYLDGITFVSLPRLEIDKNLEYFKNYEDAVITPKGIEFLQENSLMRKAYDIVKDFKPW